FRRVAELVEAFVDRHVRERHAEHRAGDRAALQGCEARGRAAGDDREAEVARVLQSFALQIAEQDRGRAAGEARDAEARAFEVFDLLKIFAADEIIRRRVARSGDSFQAAALLIPQDNAVRIDVRDMQLAGDKRPDLEIGATDEDELDLHAL